MVANETSLAMFGQDTLESASRQAALTAAQSVLDREGVSAREAVDAYAVDLLLAEELDVAERTDAHFREHGASLKACEAYYAAVQAAETEIGKRDPANARFHVLLSLAA